MAAPVKSCGAWLLLQEIEDLGEELLALLLEEPAANPFLGRFYENPERYALPTQLFFLFQRVDQLRSLNQSDLFKRATVADFMLEKDALFARLNLKDDELKLYEQIYEHVYYNEISLWPEDPASAISISFICNGTDREHQLYLRYYADGTAGIRSHWCWPGKYVVGFPYRFYGAADADSGSQFVVSCRFRAG